MPDLSFGVGAYARLRGNMPELPVVNMTAEAAPSADKGVVLQSRPGLETDRTVGSGPIHGLFSKNGVFSGALFAVSGNRLYRNATSLGTITGTGIPSFSAGMDRILVTRGKALYRYDGTLAPEAFPDSADVAAVGYLAGYEFAVKKGSNALYFRQGTADDWDGLDFVNAENEPDELRDIVVMDDYVVLPGAESVEFWAKTGDPDAPITPIEGRVFDKGVIATGCAVRFDNSFAWISDEKIVYVAANVPQRISDDGIDERLSKSASFRLFTYFFEGVEHLVVRLDDSSWKFSAASKQWNEDHSFGHANFRAMCATKDPNGPLFGSDSDGSIYRFSDTYRELDGPLERRFRAGAPLRGGSVVVRNVRLTVNVGETFDLTGYASDPIVEMRASRDGARTWSAWQPAKLGEQGKYRTQVEWRAQGMFDAPGILFEFRVTDPVPFRASAVSINEAGGGRSR